MEAKIRLAQREDLQRLNSIYNWAVLHTTATFDLEPRSQVQAEQWYSEHQEKLYPLYVLTVGGDIAGWGSLSPFHPRPAYLRSGEFSLYFAPEFHRQGLGGLLLGHLCSVAGQAGYHTLLGLITETNKASLAPAARHGFFRAGRYKEVGKKFNQWLDVVVVQRMFSM